MRKADQAFCEAVGELCKPSDSEQSFIDAREDGNAHLPGQQLRDEASGAHEATDECRVVEAPAVAQGATATEEVGHVDASGGVPTSPPDPGIRVVQGRVTLTSPKPLQALVSRVNTGYSTLVVAERRGRLRDASNRRGKPAISVDVLECESAAPGYHFKGEVDDIEHIRGWERVFSFMPCEQQTISLGPRMSTIKAAEGRMFWGMMLWLRAWCIDAECVVAEQPRLYIPDFYDAPCMVTNMAEWGSEWDKNTLLFVRGADFATPTHPGAKGSREWQAATAGLQGQDGTRGHARDATPIGLARARAEQIKPTGSGPAPRFEIERERLAAAWYMAGLPVPHDYQDDGGLPRDAETRAYMRSCGP
jgi:hypothetical protein